MKPCNCLSESVVRQFELCLQNLVQDVDEPFSLHSGFRPQVQLTELQLAINNRTILSPLDILYENGKLQSHKY